MNTVKKAKTAPEPKTPGTVAVEKHRPLLNKLTEAQRRRLRQRAAALLYGHEATAPGR
jgi:Mlc titration factor MtfA (ptsG expression regulator)